MQAEWMSLVEGERPEDKWDADGVKTLLAKTPNTNMRGGAVVVLPGGVHQHFVDLVNERLSSYRWVLVVITADEQGIFPRERLSHPFMRVWVQTPHRQVIEGERYLAYPCPRAGVKHQSPTNRWERGYAWSFSGQVTHERRKQAWAAMERMHILSSTLGRHYTCRTDGFAQGLPREAYYDVLAKTMIAVCPSGATTPDTFRHAEALELGCVPIVDAMSPQEETGYWELVYGVDHPLMEIYDWSYLPQTIDTMLENYERELPVVRDWWRGYNDDLAVKLVTDVKELMG